MASKIHYTGHLHDLYIVFTSSMVTLNETAFPRPGSILVPKHASVSSAYSSNSSSSSGPHVALLRKAQQNSSTSVSNVTTT